LRSEGAEEEAGRNVGGGESDLKARACVEAHVNAHPWMGGMNGNIVPTEESHDK